MEIDFLHPRLTGPRFEDHSIPVELLGDFAALEGLIFEVARDVFLEENPDRQRVPRNFLKDAQLRLADVEPGSARPVVKLFVGASVLVSPFQGQVEAARDRVVEAIASTEDAPPGIVPLSDKALSYFDRFGRSLHHGEAIEFDRPGGSGVARLTPESRKALLLSSKRVTEVTQETSVRGAIPEADQEKETFEVLLPDGRRIAGPISDAHRESILAAFAEYKGGTRVRITGVGRFDRSDRLRSLESIEDVEPLEPRDVPARLEELKTLKRGWLDGKGEPLSTSGLDWFAQAFEANYSEDCMLPLVFPTAEGGIQAEWVTATHDISLEVDLASRRADLHALNLQTDDDIEQSLDLSESTAWSTVLEWVAKADEGRQ